MLRIRTKEQGMRGQRGTTIWSAAAKSPGAPLCVYCPSSIPAELSFDGTLNFRHIGLESKGILDNRQLQM
jgi:hypothetical protein